MNKRQQIVIQLLDLNRGFASRIQLTKLLFLLKMESSIDSTTSFYSFVPYRFGPYSFGFAREVDELVRTSVLAEVTGGWQLARNAILEPSRLSRSEVFATEVIHSRYGGLMQDELLEFVYNKYPWYTMLSDYMEKRRVVRPNATPAIYTIGYEGLSIDSFLNSLLETGIRSVIDVRNNAFSRVYGFHGTSLRRILGYLDFDYLHFPDLGVEVKERRTIQKEADRSPVFERYLCGILQRHQAQLDSVAEILRSRPAVLLCLEADPESCHRSYLARTLAPIADLKVIHLSGRRTV